MEFSDDTAGNVVETVVRRRYHNAPDNQTGPLEDPTRTLKARVTYVASYPDALGPATTPANSSARVSPCGGNSSVASVIPPRRSCCCCAMAVAATPPTATSSTPCSPNGTIEQSQPRSHRLREAIALPFLNHRGKPIGIYTTRNGRHFHHLCALRFSAVKVTETVFFTAEKRRVQRSGGHVFMRFVELCRYQWGKPGGGENVHSKNGRIRGVRKCSPNASRSEGHRPPH